MSFLSGLIAQPGTLALGAGLVAGAVAGTAVVASGVLSGPPAPAELALVSCPGNDTVVARVSSGQSILVTARSGDGAWLELYIGEPGVDTGWAPVDALKFTESVDSLPVDGACSAVAVASTGPADTLGPPPTPTPTPTPLPPGVTATPFVPTPVPTATPKPTIKVTLPPGVTPTPFVATPLPPPPTIPPPTPTPTPTPVPTAAPDLTPPSITGVSISGAYTSGNGNYYIYAPAAVNCPYHSATISATVTDAGGSGLAGFTVHLHWKDPNGNTYDQQMSYNLTTHLYNKTISAVNGWAENAYLEYWITASDNANNSTATSHPPTNSLWLFTGQCLN